MDISLAKNALKIGTFVKGKDNNGNYKNEIVWEKWVTNDYRKDNNSRIYILTVNNKIMKIGGSQDKNGIQGTLSIYKNGGAGGRPSIRSYGVFMLVKRELELGNKVDIYLIKQEKVNAIIRTMYKDVMKYVNVNYNDVENECLKEYSDYMNSLNKDNVKYFPEWNYQEAGKDWPQYIKENHAKMINESLKKGRKK